MSSTEDPRESARPAPQGTPQSSQAGREGGGGGGLEATNDHQVNDLRKGMERPLIQARLAAGYSNLSNQTVYNKAWQTLQQHILGQLSNQFWNNILVTMPSITQVLQYRFGQLLSLGRPA